MRAEGSPGPGFELYYSPVIAASFRSSPVLPTGCPKRPLDPSLSHFVSVCTPNIDFLSSMAVKTVPLCCFGFLLLYHILSYCNLSLLCSLPDLFSENFDVSVSYIFVPLCNSMDHLF